MSPYFLESRRLGFRRWTPDDLELAIGLWGDPSVTKFIDARPRLSRSEVMERLQAELDLGEQHSVQYWPIFFLESGQHAGCCGLRPYDQPGRIYELGFHIRPAFWRMGVADEAARAVINHAFGPLDAISLFAGHHPGNEGSARLLAKLGFRPDGHVLYPPTGLEHPTYCLHRTEWRRRA